MHTLFKIIKKNFKLLIRSKSSALIIILGPLLVIFLVGIAFDNINKFSLNIGTYSESYSQLTESFTLKLEENNFQVQRIDSEEECVDLIKQGKLNTCIVYPKDLTINSNKINEIVFHVDNSKINLVWMVLETISGKLEERSSELSMGLTTDLLDKVDLTKNELYRARPTITNLKTENQQLADRVGISSISLGDAQTKISGLKSNMLLKVQGIEKVVSELHTKINKSNITSDEKSSFRTRLSEIETYLYNIRGKFEEQSTVSVSEITQITNLLNEAGSNINAIKSTLSSSGTKITEIQAAIDKIYNEVSSIQITDAATIVNPISTRIKPVATEKSNLNYLFPSLVILVIMFISILLSNTLVMMEKHSPAYFRNFITPTRDIIFILATYLTNVLLVFLQLIIILAISAVFFKAQVLSAIPATILILLLSITFFTFVGMIIGYIFTSEETSTLAAISIGSIFLFLSNVILPLESMPSYVKNIAQFNPFILGESLLRKAIIFQAKFSSLSKELLILFAYSAVLFLIIWLSQKAVRKHLGHKIAYMKYQKFKKLKKKKVAKTKTKKKK
ncbi:ABC transporter permease [Candidatus Woesearchaeota archaeon]|nr:ABC transporter permease [Candidatus Woesearchaeota archaeon]